jgi:hypothetical protein
MQTRYARFSALVIAGFLGGPAAGQEAVDMRLEDAGFTMRTANTPEQLARLKLLPPRKFVARKKAGTRYFLYADPDYCKCVFLGGAQALQTYRNMSAPGLPLDGNLPPTGVSPVNEIIQDMDDDIGVGEDDILDFNIEFGR